MPNNKIVNDKGVRENRLIMVNPNLENNGLVPHEDLCIVVDLETEKKGRDLISVVKNTVNVEQTSDKTLKVRFFEGNDINGKQSLTTNYTNIGNSYKNGTTTFNKKGEEFEGLGITSIDIDFNSSYAPLIKINFVDIRGSSILEQGNESKYSVFFNMPYPIFKLTIKGYFGQAVTYCLHLTKWNAKFNSDTGNFEIQCDFIGHTYAFLTDMLIGYLRACVEIPRGKELLGEAKSKNKEIISINDLITEISQLSTYLTKLKEKKNTPIKDLAVIEEKLVQLETLKDSFKDFEDIIIKNESKNRSNNLIGDDGGLFVISTPTDDAYNTLKKDIGDYEVLIDGLLVDLNNNLEGNLQLKKTNYSDFLVIKSVVETFMDGTETNVSNVFGGGTIKNNQIYISKLGQEKFDTVYSILSNKLNNNGISNNSSFIVVDLGKAYDDMDSKTKELTTLKDINRELVSGEISKTIINESGFNPTIKNIFTILATHVDIFMKLIREYASQANNNQTRDNKFKRYLDKLDVKTTTANKTTNGLPSKIYPFPMYEKDGKEAWIGNEISNIPETDFVEELLKGFLKNVEADKVASSNLNSGFIGNGWRGINVLDTPLFNTINPYEEIKDAINYDIILNKVIERALLYLNYSNSRVNGSELEIMAKIEAENLLKYNSSEIVLRGLTTVSGNTITEQVNTLINKYKTNTKGKFLEQTCTDGNGDIVTNYYLESPILVNKEGKLSYGRYLPYTNLIESNATYLELKTVKEYEALSGSLPAYESLPKTENKGVLDLDLIDKHSLELKDKSNLLPEYNSLEGIYGITEFFNVVLKSGGEVYPSESLFWSSLTERIHSKRQYNGLFVGNGSETPRWEKMNQLYTIKNFNTNELESIDKQFIGFQSFRNSSGVLNKTEYSLFGSELYFRQSDNLSIGHPKYKTESERKIVANRARAILFLHTLPFDGLWGPEGLGLLNNNTPEYDTLERKGYNTYGSLKLALFDRRGGFVKVPKAWLLLVGGLLWRYKEVNSGDLKIDPIRFSGSDYYSGTKKTKYFIHDISENNNIPSHVTYLKQKDSSNFDNTKPSDEAMSFASSEGYTDFEDTFRNLPEQVKNILIKYFTDWTDGTNENEINWNVIRGRYEIDDIDSITYNNYQQKVKDREVIWREIYDIVQELEKQIYAKNSLITISTILDKVKVILRDKGYKNLDIISSITTNRGLQDGDDKTNPNYGVKPNYDIIYVKSIDDKTNSISDMISTIVEPVVVANVTWRIWGNDASTYNLLDCTYTKTFSAYNTDLNKYLEVFLGFLKEKLKTVGFLEKKEQAKKEAFGTIDNDLIKLNIYRTIKAIYDKWVAGDDPSISGIVNCLTGSQGDLIDTFRFLDKSFKDIGDEFLINPVTIINQIQSNTNQSFYDFISRILVDNNFDFIALPNFIDYKDVNQMKKIFEPVPYVDYVDEKTIGPTFVCMYIGKSSRNLDLDSGDYRDDGLQLDVNGELPDDFSEPSIYTIPAFGVNYAQGNQSIFKSISLDQSEFSETDESLRIIDSISLQGDTNNRTPVGQNLWNVYSVRSYSAEIEMLGNAMIQPIMYFQLNNIPMFRGGYLITRVTHKIVPNDMSTTFKGVRVSKLAAPLVDSTELFMNLLGSLDDVDTKGTKVSNNSNTEMVINARDVEPEVIKNLDFGCPVNNLKVSCGIGPRDIDVDGASTNHKGIDSSIVIGTDLLAIQSGTIELIRLRKGYGLHIITKHIIDGVTWRALYAHLSDVPKELTGLDLNNLTEEQKKNLISDGIPMKVDIKKGEIIAKSGGSGDKNIGGIKFRGTSSGNHLHFEIREEKTPNISLTNSAYYNNSIVRDPAQLLGLTKYDTDTNQNRPKEGTITITNNNTIEAPIASSKVGTLNNLGKTINNPLSLKYFVKDWVGIRGYYTTSKGIELCDFGDIYWGLRAGMIVIGNKRNTDYKTYQGFLDNYVTKSDGNNLEIYKKFFEDELGVNISDDIDYGTDNFSKFIQKIALKESGSKLNIDYIKQVIALNKDDIFKAKFA